MKKSDQQIGASQMKEIASIIQNKINGLGFALLIFPFEAPGMANYVSNAERDGMIKAFEEVLFRWKNNQDFMTPETN